MNVAFWILVVCASVLWALTGMAFKAADRPGDDFGAGMLVWLLAFVALIFTIAAFITNHYR